MDYKKIGLKSGIEIHQQLNGRKLFCNCPTEIRKGKADFEIIRQLRASAGESGELDKAAEFEQQKKKMFKYQGYDDITCLVETDEEPPQMPSEEAITSAVQVAKLLNCTVVDRIEFMRKVVVDGSNVSGFQRTAIVGLNGYIEVEGKKYGIETVCLEEEACQAVERSPQLDVYNLSRLGIPLIEIATAPDMETPEEIKNVAASIGMILRSINNCKRGIGSIRQDVNVSIKGGVRVEIKGFQDIKSIPKIVDYEINRQLTARKEEKKPHVRKAEPDLTTSYLRPMPGASRMYPETDIRPIITPKNVVLPKLLSTKKESLEKKFKIPEHLTKELVKKNIDFAKYADKYEKVKPLTLAEFFIVTPKEIRRKEKLDFDPEKNLEVMEKLNSAEIEISAIPEITLRLAKGEKVDYTKYKSIDDKKILEELKKIVEANKGAPTNAIMGLAMKEFKGRVDGKKVMIMLQKLIK